LGEDKVLEIILQAKAKTEESHKKIKQILKQQKDKEKKIYKDETLEKILEIAENTFKEKDDLIDFV
jgi:replicative superfamily II helicase